MLPPASLRLRQIARPFFESRGSHSRFRAAAGSVLVGAALAACASSATPVEEAALLAEKGQEAQAIQVLNRAIKRHPPAIAERRLVVRLEAMTGDLGAAERAADDLARVVPPDSPIPWLELGHALEIAHRYDEALALYDRASTVAPKDPEGPRTAGLRAARWGEAELAAPRLEEALRRDPRDAAVWHALGLVRLRLGDPAGAKTAYQSGLVADPHALENRIGLATVALSLDDGQGALRQYDAVLRERPHFAEGYLGRSWAFILLGRFGDARAALADATQHGADPSAVKRQERLISELIARGSESAARGGEAADGAEARPPKQK